ncbi:MAG: ZIP family metal transporter [Deltaproteobacteria bacterium]|nr:ZIP family metal transporter [Deltaproteobacteria bacterium]
MHSGSLIVYSALILAASVAGGMLPLYWRRARDRLPFLLSVSAGFMVGAIFFHMLPEAIELAGTGASLGLLVGFLLLYVLERFMTIHVCEGAECGVHELGILAFVGMSVHTLTDGLALGAGMHSAALGFSIFLAILAHKVPSAFSLSTILAHAGYGIKKIVVMMIVFALLVPAGAAIYWAVRGVFESFPVEGYAVAFACGSFLHIALSDLIPEMHRNSGHRYAHSGLFLSGIAVMALLGRLVRHG